MLFSLFYRISLLATAMLFAFSLTGQSVWQEQGLQIQFDSLVRLAGEFSGDSLTRKSWLLHEAGKVADDAGRPLEAIESTAKALELRLKDEALLGDGVLVSAMNLGIYYSSLEQYSEALRYFGMVTSRAPNRKEAIAWYQTGRIFGRTGQFSEGEQAFRRAAALPDFADSPYLNAYLQQQLGALNLRRYSAAGGEAAIPSLKEALRYFVQDEDRLGEMETRNFLGWAYTEIGEYDLATRELKQAMALAKALDQQETLASIHNNLGLTFRRRGDTQDAILEYIHGLEILGDLEADPVDMAPFLNNLSTAKLEAGQPGEALVHAQKALELGIPDYEFQSFMDLPDLEQITIDAPAVLIYLKDLARANRASAEILPERGHTEAALAAFRLADKLLDRMRRNQLLEDTRTYWRADARGLYDEAISTALEAGKAETVFYFLEKARARLLLDEVSAGRAEELLPSEVRDQLQDYARSARLHTDEPEQLRRFRLYQDSLLTAFPEYARQRMGAEPPTSQELPDILNGRYLVEYYVSSAMTLALVCSPKGEMQIHKLSAPAEWEPILWTYREQLTSPNTTPDHKLAVQLYDQLLQPLDLPAEAELVIIPDGELYLLPFGTLLPRAPNDSQDLKNWPWLTDRHNIAYAHSVQLLKLATELRGRGNGRVLALAPVARIEDGNTDLELPATLRTVRHLSRLFPTDTLINHAATHAAFLSRADAYSLLHLGTHAYPHEGGSFLLRDEPSLYQQADLLNHRFKAELVVIGACETGLGEQLIGEGVASLGRGFARRGAPGLIMSLWSIDDAATADLLDQTYDGLAQGKGPATALRAAGGTYRKNATNPRLSHPYYWAGLVSYGRDEPLQMSATGSRWWIYGLAFGSLLLILTLWLRRR